MDGKPPQYPGTYPQTYQGYPQQGYPQQSYPQQQFGNLILIINNSY